ncbi:MAG: ISNCY family transposase [Acidobacteria bacterium]|nr:ISNCY family transposase [Acidobacteriota bacterium]
MVRRRQRERSVWEVVLPDADKLWPDALRRMDRLIDDEALAEVVANALERRWPHSRRRGRPGTPADVVLRMLVLKHLYRWSYTELEQEVRANLVYRAFARISCEVAPDAKTILKIAQALGPAVIQTLHRRVVELAVRGGVVKGRRLRVDTTVIETNIHYPTDSSLLTDGVRVATRTLKKIEAAIGRGRRAVRNRMRSVTRRGLEIMYAARSPKTREGLGPQLSAVARHDARAVLRDADTMTRRVRRRLRAVDDRTRRRMTGLQARLRTIIPLIRRVIAQTEQRVLHGDTHVPDKVMSLFEPHTEGIRKGKLVKPTEFGKLVTIQEAEHQIVTAYAVHAERPADQTLWVPALDAHQQIFHRAPHLAAADRGFASAANEKAATTRGVRRMVLPRPGPNTPARRAHERQRWFRRGQRWRVGCEGRVSVLKRRHGLHRCLYHGLAGTERWVGLGVIANNLLVIAARPAPP